MKESDATLRADSRTRELRRAFDATFAAPPPPPAPPTSALLLVRAGRELIAIDRRETTGFARADSVVRAPGRSPAFLGIAALRDDLFPVWSLAGLLGQPVPAAGSGWLALTQASDRAPCAFYCEAFERMILVPTAVLASAARRDPPPGLSTAMAPWGASLVPLADLPALHAEIRKRKDSLNLREPSP